MSKKKNDEQAEDVKAQPAPAVLTQDEVDKLVVQANAGLQAALDAKDAEIAELARAAGAATEYWKVQADAKDAEITTLRQKVKTLDAQLAEAFADLHKATDPVHGIVHPRSTDDLPALGDLPAHKPID